MKANIKTIGIDDAPFELYSSSQREAMIVGVVMRSNHYLEGVLSSSVKIDGTNSTRNVVDMVRGSKHYRQLKAIFLDGITMGGFNVLDIDRIFDFTGIPVLSLTRNQPEFESIEHALKKHFEDGAERWSLISKGKLLSFETPAGTIYGKIAGLSWEQAQELIDITIKHGQIPEPIRVAHLIASGVVKGESSGKV